MKLLYVQMDDELSIEPYPNQKHNGSITSKMLDAIPDTVIPIFISPQPLKDLSTIGSRSENSVCIVRDENVSRLGSPINNAFLMVENEDRLFENFKEIAPKTLGFIEIKCFDPDLDKLDIQLEKITDYMIEHPNVLVFNLNGYRIKNKFSMWGDTAFYMSPLGDIYSHPGFYYNKMPDKKLGTIYNFDFDDERHTHFTKPHLMCLNCETFYCDRNIYQNKLSTGEYLVPSSSTCALTTLFMKHSIKLFNRMSDVAMEPHNLDRIDEFDDSLDYKMLESESCMCNRIKGLDFKNRLLKG